MKIALVQNRFPNSNGNSIYLRPLSKYLRMRGHRLMLLSRKPSSSIRLFDQSCSAALEQIRQFGPDVVLEDCGSLPVSPRMHQAIKSEVGVPVVSILESLSQGHLHRGAWFKTPRHRHESDFFESVDAVVFSSRTIRNAVRRQYGQSGHSIVAYPAGDHVDGIDSPEKIVARARRCGPLQLLFRGDAGAGSGLIQLIRALQAVPEGAWQLRIVGDFRADRSYTKRVLRLLRRAELEDWVEFSGPLQGKALSECYAASHAVIVPFSSDRYEPAVIEAMGYGLPAFCPAGGACRELVQDDVNGFLVSPYDRETICRNVEALYTDRDKLVVMGLAAWSAFQQHPKWADCVNAIESLLIHVNAGSGKRLSSNRSSTDQRNMFMLRT